MNSQEYIAKILLSKKAVSLNPSKPFTYASGIKSPIYCDNRKIISFPIERKYIINTFCEYIENMKIDFDIIAGTATAGIPWAAWIADKTNKPMIYVRSSKKDHGKTNQIEGSYEKHQKVILIEDLISTGKSSISAIEALESESLNVLTCLAIFSYELDSAKSAFQKQKVPYYSLSNFLTLLETAKNDSYLSQDEYLQAKEWNKNPNSWNQK